MNPYAQLLANPGHAVTRLLDEDRWTYAAPLLGYILIAFASSGDETLEKLQLWPQWARLLVNLVLATVFWGPILAIVQGGLLHLSSRVLGGRAGFEQTLRAVGYSLLWPGAVMATTTVLMATIQVWAPWIIGLVVALAVVHFCAWLWGVVSNILALQARHEFSGGRAVAAYFLPVLALFALMGVVVILFFGLAMVG